MFSRLKCFRKYNKTDLITRAGNRAAPDIKFVNKYPPSWMKKGRFLQGFFDLVDAAIKIYSNEHASQFS